MTWNEFKERMEKTLGVGDEDEIIFIAVGEERIEKFVGYFNDKRKGWMVW